VTFVAFTTPSGSAQIALEYVAAIQQLPGDAATRVWWLADGAPGATRNYTVVQGGFYATLAALAGSGAFVFNTTTAEYLAVVPRWVTSITSTPGDAFSRVTWAADAPDGYAVVKGSIASVTAALAYTPSVVGPGGPLHSVQCNGGGGFVGYSQLQFDGANLVSSNGGLIALGCKGSAQLSSTSSFASLNGATDVQLNAGGAIACQLAKELVVNGNGGNAGEVLTSSGPGLPPTWALLPQPAPVAGWNVSINATHNGASPQVLGAFYVDGTGTVMGAQVLLDSAGATQGQVDVIDVLGTVVQTFFDSIPATGLRVVFPSSAPTLSAGWYRLQLSTSGGPVTLLGAWGTL